MGRYAQIRKMDVSNGDGVGIAYFSQGCHFHCKNCHNESIWNFDGGTEFSDETINTIIELASKPYISRLSILGGESLCEENIEDTQRLIIRFKEVYPNKKIWIWTGYLIDDISNKSILDYADYIIDGQFKNELYEFNLKLRGSTNQRIWKKDINNNWIDITSEV